MTANIDGIIRPYILWRRVSTKRQGRSGLGLEAQTSIAQYFMKGTPDETYTDVYTGTKLSECKELWKAIRRCKEKNCLLVIASTDRFRNVKEALEVLDAVGEGNLAFCDIPTTDRTILTIVFAIWERQAIQIRIKTKIALDERIKQRDQNGYWISKTGNLRTALGQPKGYRPAAAQEAAIRSKQEAAIQWQQTSPAFAWVRQQVAKGKPRKEIIQDFNELHQTNPTDYSTREGAPLSPGVLSKWIRLMNLDN